MDDKAEIFISYKSERRQAAEHLAEILRLHGYTVWFDYDLVKGKDFARQIDRRVRAAKALIVLWCTRSVQSEWVHDEVDLATELGILIPVKIEACSLQVGNRRKDYVDLAAWDGSPRSHALDPLFGAVAQLVGRYPQQDYQKLVDYERQWRRFGALPLSAFALRADLEATVGARPLVGLLWPAMSATPSVNYAAQGRIQVAAKYIHGAPDGWFKPGLGQSEWFKDHESGPEMVVVPAGSFTMGSPPEEPRWSGYDGREEPQHPVTIKAPFAVGRHAVTRAAFAAFQKATGHNTDGGAYVLDGKEWKLDPKKSWRVPGFTQDDTHPVVCVSWEDAQAYCRWLSTTTHATYRLLSEAEWEYVCRAGTKGPFWWDGEISISRANYDGNYTYGSSLKGKYLERTVPVDSFAPNPWGLYQVHGNVWEWCQDNWHADYKGAPSDESVWPGGDASSRVLRGGSWSNVPQYLRSALRLNVLPDLRSPYVGFRVARTL